LITILNKYYDIDELQIGMDKLYIGTKNYMPMKILQEICAARSGHLIVVGKQLWEN